MVPLILAIETSCDDTSVCIYKNNKFYTLTKSSTKLHTAYGGIVPEIAAREHASCLDKLVNQILKKTKTAVKDIDTIAYTCCPGLVGSIKVGKIYAETLALAINANLVPINHLHGHIFSFNIENKQKIKYPFLSLVVSGGHTNIYKVKSLKTIELLMETKDDAIGECLDKIGRKLNLPYPAGKYFDDMYQKDLPKVKLIPHAPVNTPISFSGLKSHIFRLVDKKVINANNHKQYCSAILKWVVDEVLNHLKFYLDKNPDCQSITMGGGVSQCKLLRTELKKLHKNQLVPLPQYCQDNAAMIAYVAKLSSNK